MKYDRNQKKRLIFFSLLSLVVLTTAFITLQTTHFITAILLLALLAGALAYYTLDSKQKESDTKISPTQSTTSYPFHTDESTTDDSPFDTTLPTSDTQNTTLEDHNNEDRWTNAKTETATENTSTTDDSQDDIHTTPMYSVDTDLDTSIDTDIDPIENDDF